MRRVYLLVFLALFAVALIMAPGASSQKAPASMAQSSAGVSLRSESGPSTRNEVPTTSAAQSSAALNLLRQTDLQWQNGPQSQTKVRATSPLDDNTYKAVYDRTEVLLDLPPCVNSKQLTFRSNVISVPFSCQYGAIPGFGDGVRLSGSMQTAIPTGPFVGTLVPNPSNPGLPFFNLQSPRLSHHSCSRLSSSRW